MYLLVLVPGICCEFQYREDADCKCLLPRSEMQDNEMGLDSWEAPLGFLLTQKFQDHVSPSGFYA